MARARNIKPGFFLNEILGTMDPMVSLLFAGLWCLADKEGRLEDRPLRIKAEIFPYREKLDVNGYLTQLEQAKFIIRYQVGESRYIEINNFKKHQNPHHTEKASTIPGSCEATVNSPLKDGGNPADSLIPDSLIPDSLIPDSLLPIKTLPSSGDEDRAQEPEFYLTRKKRKLTGKRLESFNRFWEAFDYKTGRAEAADSWLDIPQLTSDLVDRIVLAAKGEAMGRPELRSQGKTPKMAQGWISARRWEDEKATSAKILSDEAYKEELRAKGLPV